MIKANEVYSRLEDMSQFGRLQLLLQDDGDVCVKVIQDDGYGKIDSIASVEYCASGGKSPRTLEALKKLIIAMDEDNADTRLDGRKVDFYARAG